MSVLTAGVARRLGAGVVLISATAVLAGCGGGSSPSSSGSQTVSTSSSAAASASTGSSPSSAASASTSASSGSSGSGGGGSATSFCGFAKVQESQEAAATKAFTSDTPKQLAAYEENALAQLKKYTATAPSSIRGDVQTLVAGVTALLDKLKAVNFDYTKLSPTTLSGFDTPAFTKASTDIAAYLKNTCGLNVTASP